MQPAAAIAAKAKAKARKGLIERCIVVLLPAICRRRANRGVNAGTRPSPWITRVLGV
jgi:hypothetical protein